MKKILLSIITLLPTLVLAETFYPHQARVIDGDTIEVLVHGQHSERVRLLGIDAPESGQDFGNRSKQTLNQCVQAGLQNRNLRIESQKRDRYNRLLGVVYAGETDCNLNQITLGMAWHYKYYLNDQPIAIQTSYAQAERTAFVARHGLWSMCATAPWRYRRGERGCDTPNVGTSPITTPAQTTNHAPTRNVSNHNTTNRSILNRNTPNTASCTTLRTMTCKQFDSCDTARLALSCGNARLDGDKDGVPCEAICR